MVTAQKTATPAAETIKEAKPALAVVPKKVETASDQKMTREQMEKRFNQVLERLDELGRKDSRYALELSSSYKKIAELSRDAAGLHSQAADIYDEIRKISKQIGANVDAGIDSLDPRNKQLLDKRNSLHGKAAELYTQIADLEHQKTLLWRDITSIYKDMSKSMTERTDLIKEAYDLRDRMREAKK